MKNRRWFWGVVTAASLALGGWAFALPIPFAVSPDGVAAAAGGAAAGAGLFTSSITPLGF